MSETLAAEQTDTQGAVPEDRKYLEAVNDLTDELKFAVEEIRAQVDALTDSDIERRHEIGRRLNEIVDDDSGLYGVDPKTALEAVMPLSKDSLRPMMVFARTYHLDEVAELLALRHPVTHERLTWTHMAALTRVPDKARANELARSAVRNAWSTKALVREIIKTSGGPRSKGGRKPKKAGNFEEAITELLAIATAFEKVADQVWLGPNGLGDHYKALAVSPGWRPSQELLAEIQKAKGVIDSIGVRVALTSQLLASIHTQAKAMRESKSFTT